MLSRVTVLLLAAAADLSKVYYRDPGRDLGWLRGYALFSQSSRLMR